MWIFIGLMILFAPVIGRIIGSVIGAVIFLATMFGTFIWMFFRAFNINGKR
jgi:hypothetical protein